MRAQARCFLGTLVTRTLGIAACSKNTAPPSPTTDSAASSRGPAGQVDGPPQLATTPDSVHIDYRVWGRASPRSCSYTAGHATRITGTRRSTPLKSQVHRGRGQPRRPWRLGSATAPTGRWATTVRMSRPSCASCTTTRSCSSATRWAAEWRWRPRAASATASSASSPSTRSKSIGLPPMRPQEIERQLAPFRANFIEATRKYVTDTVVREGRGSDAGAEGRLRHVARAARRRRALAAVAARDGLHDAAAGHPRTGARRSTRTSAPTDEARIRKSLPGFKVDVLEHTGHFPDDGSARALQPGAC